MGSMMRLLLFVCSLLKLSPSLASSPRRNSELSVFCPTAPPDVSCSGVFEETECGPNRCIYENSCLASAAGFVSSQCFPPTCPDPPSNVSCGEDLSDPVNCGTLGCVFDNQCLAIAAGFSVHDCVSTQWCPAVPSDANCRSIDFVKCGERKCVYSNPCEAGAAGFVTNQCVSTSCPDPVGMCTTEYAPLVCGENGCKYDNDCWAASAGFDPQPSSGLCFRVQLPSTSGSDCPFVPQNVVCSRTGGEVVCGSSNCIYSNLCEANAAGFLESECAIRGCPSVPNHATCESQSDPVECGDLGCLYDNSCLARAAGFTDGNDCRPENWCPAVPKDANCLASEEVKCGKTECTYESYCDAVAAGFRTHHCSPTRCPIAPEIAECSNSYKSVVCGEDRCLYENICWAESAGFVSSECTRAGCPYAAPNVCTTEAFEPVNCGLECEFENLCLGMSAGFEPSQCKCPGRPPQYPDIGGKCEPVHEPVRCGARNCTYENLCTAKEAGYRTDDCVLKLACPSSTTVECSGEYNPVVCDPGGCEYDNECLAKSAGFDTTGSECSFLFSEENRGDGVGYLTTAGPLEWAVFSTLAWFIDVILV